MIPEQVQTKDGCIQIKVLPWLQYIKYRVSLHGWKYLFQKTSAGYPRFLSLGYYSKEMKEIVVAKVGEWQLRVMHETGHANGLKHVNILGDVMHPLGHKRGPYTHSCIYQVESFAECKFNEDKHNWCIFAKKCMHLKRERIVFRSDNEK